MKTQRLFPLAVLCLIVLVITSACNLSHRARPAVLIVNPGRASIHDINHPVEISLEPNDATSDAWTVTDGVTTRTEGGIHPAGYVYRTSLLPTWGGAYELTVSVHFIDHGWRSASTCYFVRDNGANANPPDGWGDCSIITRAIPANVVTRTPTVTPTITFTPTASILQPANVLTALPPIRDITTPSGNNDNGGSDNGPGEGGGESPVCQPPPDNCGDGVWDPTMCACGPG